MQTVQLRNRRHTRVQHGHAWVFANEIDGDVSALPPGGAVRVETSQGRFLGIGYANPASLITIRLLSRDPDADIDSVEFFEARLRDALALRRRVLPDRRSLRLVAGEADDLPGLVVDRYDDVLAVQVGTLGIEHRLELVGEALRRVFAPRAAVLRNDGRARLLEGLELGSAHWFGEPVQRVRFAEGPVQLVADVAGGQKTGFFFDQATNRAFARERAEGARVLDLYAHSGAWAIGSLLAGARDAVAVDIQAGACELIAENAALNDVQERLQIIQADAREAITSLLGQGRRFDHVYVDPPAFAKQRKKTGAALRAYRNLNQQALGLVAPGGLLFTSSCSYHAEEARFLAEVLDAGRRAGRSMRLVRRGEQAPDHPVHPEIPETRYLKHYVFFVR